MQISHQFHQRPLLRLPKQPTIAGWFWFAYFVALAWLIFG
jgi:hypothetical protein